MSIPTYKNDYILKADAGVKLVLLMQNDTDFQFIINKKSVKTVTIDASNSDSPVTKTLTVQSSSSAYANSYIITTYSKNAFNNTTSQCNLCFNLTNPGGDSYWSITGTPSQGDNQSMFKNINTAGYNNTVEVQVSTEKNPPINPSQAPVLDPNLVFLLDKSEDTLLFRGNAPLGAYDKVKNPLQLIEFPSFMDALKSAYKKSTTEEMPSESYELCVIALLADNSDNILNPEYQSFGGEHSAITNQTNWYPALADNPTKITTVTPNITGRICQWNINPAGSKDGHYVTMVKELATNINTWFKSNLTDSSSQTDKGAAKKRIIYFHCSSGHDRTGMAASTYVAYKKISESKFINGSKFEIADLVESYLMGTTLNHIPYTGGHYAQTTYNLGTTTKNPNKSRCFLNSVGYDDTVSWVADKMVGAESSFNLKGTAAVSGDLNYPNENGNDAYVEKKYVWEL